jgi:antitoxin CptB
MTDPDHPASDAADIASSGIQHNAPSGARNIATPDAQNTKRPCAEQTILPGVFSEPPSDVRRRRLLFRSTHRGTYENDLMIGGFVRAHLMELTEAELDALEVVMEIPDTDLADWLTGRVPIPPEEETPMLRRMRDFLAR